MKVTRYEPQNTVLYLSGMFGGGWAWDGVIKRLWNTKAVVVDDPLCAIGGSVNSITNELVPIVKSIRGPATVVGNSLGGIVALKLASLLPECVDQVVISGSAGFNVVDLGYPFDRHNIDAFARKLGKSIYYDEEKMTICDLDRVRACLSENIRAVARLMNEGNKKASADELLGKVTQPVYAIWGKQDTVTPLASAMELLRKHGIPVNVIDRCGHSPMREAPKEFARHLSDLLAFRQPMKLKLLA